MNDGTLRLSLGATSTFLLNHDDHIALRSAQKEDHPHPSTTAPVNEEAVEPPAVPFGHHCGFESADLRVAVDLGTRKLFSVLDSLVKKTTTTEGEQEENQRKGIKNLKQARRPLLSMAPSYATYEDVLLAGEHLEHLHAYYSPSSPSTTSSSTDAGEAVRADTSELELATMDFHTDGGLFIAMTTGLYQSSSSSSPSSTSTTAGQVEEADPTRLRGLYITLPTTNNGGGGDKIARAQLLDDALVIMVGEAGARWLNPVLGRPLRAAPHALYADLGTHSASASTRESRAW
jgi:hypothetical protein